ncbi:DNA adenine methylase [Sulfurimonas sp.]|uniref:DNA adenine methylase n=1 Tax=Sulfurimonas sp. TaxID=2022749 RepID=UPI0025D22B44|nr:DNA adenine methylase [Sulfurimonas sp.]
MQSKKKKLRAPFGWVGGKSKLAIDIVDLIPHDHTTYIEVFGGALSVFYAKEKSKLEVVNDINSDLINLHRSIRTNPQTLSLYLNQLLISREIFDDIRHKRLNPRNNIEAAAFYLYQLTQSFGSKGDNFAMSAKSGRKPKDIYKSYKKWSDRLKGVTIENKSFQVLIPLYDKEDVFFYVDPPYVSTESYYKNTGGFGEKEHKHLAALLSNVKGRFLLSYNDCELVRELYKDFNIKTTKEIEYTLGKNVHGKSKSVREVIITNY